MEDTLTFNSLPLSLLVQRSLLRWRLPCEIVQVEVLALKIVGDSSSSQKINDNNHWSPLINSHWYIHRLLPAPGRWIMPTRGWMGAPWMTQHQLLTHGMFFWKGGSWGARREPMQTCKHQRGRRTGTFSMCSIFNMEMYKPCFGFWKGHLCSERRTGWMTKEFMSWISSVTLTQYETGIRWHVHSDGLSVHSCDVR